VFRHRPYSHKIANHSRRSGYIYTIVPAKCIASNNTHASTVPLVDCWETVLQICDMHEYKSVSFSVRSYNL